MGNDRYQLNLTVVDCIIYDISAMSPIIDLNVLCALTISYGRLIKCLIKVVQQQSIIVDLYKVLNSTLFCFKCKRVMVY